MVHVNTLTPTNGTPPSDKNSRRFYLWLSIAVLGLFLAPVAASAQICCPISQPLGAEINLSVDNTGTATVNPTLFIPYVGSPNPACLPANGGNIFLWEDASATIPFPTTIYNCAHVGTSVTLFVTLAAPGPPCPSPPAAPFVVNIVDFVPPVVDFPDNVTASADTGACSKFVNSLVTLASDNCSGSFTVEWMRTGVTLGSGSGVSANGIYNVGTTNISWKVIYLVSAGNNDTISGTTTVVITDDEDPVLTPCPSNIVQSNYPVMCNAFVTWTAPTASDNCPGVGVTQTSSPLKILPSTPYGPGDTYPVGTTVTITYTATDASGNTDMCSFTVTVNDDELPVLTGPFLPASIIVSPSPGCSQLVSLDGGGATDNCGLDLTNYADGFSFSIVTNSGGPPPAASGTSSDASGTYPVGDYDITYTAHDIHGNTSSYTINLVVEDQLDPAAVCQNITVQLDANGSVTVTGNDIDGGSTDNCGIVTWNIAHDVSPTDGLPDAPGPPYFHPSVTFNCTNITTTNTVLLEVIDASDNRDTCSAEVTVEDNLPPVAICQDITVDLITGMMPSVSVYAEGTSPFIDNGSHDNCTSPLTDYRIRKGTSGPFNAMGTPVMFFCADMGPNIVEIQVTDAKGNSNICQATVTVRDVTPPVAVCSPHTAVLDGSGNVTISASDVDGGSSDDCFFDLSVFPASFTCDNLGPNTVTLTVTDDGNNTATCTATVIVEDNTPPTALCNATFTAQLDATGNVTVMPDDIDAGSTDNCTIVSRVVSPNMFGCLDVSMSPLTVILTVTDQSGNVSSCSSSVTVEDNIAPVAVCSSVSVAVGSNGEVNISPFQVGILSTDNCCLPMYELSVDTDRDNIPDSPFSEDPWTFDCDDVSDPGGVAVRVRVTDCHGNFAICQSTVTIQDLEVPAITCPANLTIECDESDHPNNTGSATATDNCGVDTITWSDALSVPSCVGTYTITRTWMAEDVNGNTATCTQTITVEDTTPPTFSTPADVVLDCPDSYVVANQVCTTYFSTDVPKFISPVGTPSVMSSLTIPDNGKILDINVVNLGIEHTWVGDLHVYLKSPSGTEILLASFQDWCGMADNVEMNFDDQGTGPYPMGYPCPPNDQLSYQPSTALSTFYQEQIFGIWKLIVEDNFGEDGGNLISWGLEICYVTPSANPATDATAASLVGDVIDEADNCDPEVIDGGLREAFYMDYHAYKDFTSHAEGGMYNFSTGQWTPVELPGSHDGFVSTAGAPGSISLTGANNGTPFSETNYGIIIPSGGIGPFYIAFDWSYQSSDSHAGRDVFGYYVNSSFTQLTDGTSCSLFGDATQSGRALILVSPGDFFEFSQQSCDGKGGSATTTITNFIFIDGGCPLPLDGCERKFCVARVWDLEDDCDNAAASQLQIISTRDITPPDIDIPTEMTVLALNGVCAPFIDLDLSQEISDECSAFSALTIMNTALADYGIGNGTFNASGYYLPGVYSIEFTATDECFNTEILALTLTVLDAQAPFAVCHPFITVQLDNTGNATLTPANVDNGSSDNCGITLMTLSQSAFSVNDIGQVPVTLTVEDAAGNTNSCSSIITVLGGVIFDAGDAGGANGDMALVPVTVENFTDITSFQFDMDITDGGVATVVGIQDVHPDLAAGFIATVNTATSVFVSWFDNTTPIGQSFTDGTVIFNLKVMLVGVAGSSTPVLINSPQSSQLIGGGPGSAIVPTLGLAGTITVLNTGVTHTISGTILREAMCGSDGIHIVTVDMTGGAAGTTTAAGSYSFTVPENASVTITPSKNINWTNGVTVNDALLVHQHAAGFTPLSSPYKIIAGDANHDNSITVFDASLIHQLSIGFIPTLPGNTSWRFVPASPPLPSNPFPVGNEYLSYANVMASIPDADFIGMKIGDVNCTADPVGAFAGGLSDRSEKLRFLVPDQSVTAGQDVWITFAAQDFNNMNGYQMTLNFDTEVLHFVEAVPGSLINLSQGNFNPLRSSEGLLATNWYNLAPVDLPDGYELFTLHFSAMKDAATLSDLLRVSEDYIVIEAIRGDGALEGIGLTFGNPSAGTEAATENFALYQNRPNPFAYKTVIGFHLPTGDEAVLTLTDAAGKVIKVVKAYYSAGYHQVIVDRDELPTGGVVFYHLETPTHSAVRKMVIME